MAHKFRLCVRCGEKIKKLQKKCPYCHTLQKTYVQSQSPLRERNLKIVNLLDSGDYTLQDIANLFPPLTRERVRQIYKTTANQPYASKHGKKQRIVKELLQIQKLKTPRFRCRGCGKIVTYEESKHRWRYCLKCYNISEVEQRTPYIYLQCLGCNKKFHPYRNWQQVKAATLFHSMDCYIKYRRSHGMFGYGKRVKALDAFSEKSGELQ